MVLATLICLLAGHVLKKYIHFFNHVKYCRVLNCFYPFEHGLLSELAKTEAQFTILNLSLAIMHGGHSNEFAEIKYLGKIVTEIIKEELTCNFRRFWLWGSLKFTNSAFEFS